MQSEAKMKANEMLLKKKRGQLHIGIQKSGSGPLRYNSNDIRNKWQDVAFILYT